MAQAVADWGVPAKGVAAIERELARLRRERQREGRASRARSSVLDLIVFATREVHARRAAASIAELSRRHPSRAVIVLADRDAPSEPEAALTVRCDVPAPADRHELCYEQVLVRARGPIEPRIASAVIPLLVSDLPVFLWWTGTPPTGAHHFTQLAGASSRVIVDSADFARAEATLPRIAALCTAGRGRYGVTDLSWTRLTAWRELVAQLFDVADFRPYLAGVTGLRASYAVDVDGRQSHPSQALLLFGWLGSRLGWSPAEPLSSSEAGGHLFRARRVGGEPFPVRLRPHYERDLAPGDLSGVRLEAAAGGRHAMFDVDRVDREHVCVRVAIAGHPVLERVHVLPPPGVVELLGEELTIMASDPAYEEALAAAVSLG
ncbi:MAG: hypothetical protein FJ034_06460 [Chloroflexi bacterium]|nr:hypothetical protein [Chloroflexota bacterium]